MNSQTKILIAEHDVADIELLVKELKKSAINYQSQIVDTEQEYLLALKNFIPDIILSDFTFPSFDGPEAFLLREKITPDTPFFFVTGTIGEENSIEYLKMGVTDYVLKDNLKPLNIKIKRALKDAKARREYKAAAAEIKASEALYHSLFDNMLEGFAHCKMIYENNVPVDFIYLNINQAFETLTGLKNITGKKATEQIPGLRTDNPELFETYSRVALTGNPERFEVYLHALKAWLDISVYSTGKGYFTAVFDVVTGKKAAEQQKEFDQSNLKALINNTDDLMWSVDCNYNLITANQAFDEIMKVNFGKPLVPGASMFSVPYPQQVLDRFKDLYNRAFNGESFTKTEHFEETVEAWLEVSYFPIRKGSEIIGTACHSRDITDSKKAEIENIKLATRLQLATNSAAIGIWDWDIENGVLNWDEGMYRLYQIDELEFESVYNGWLSRIHPDDREQINGHIQNAISGKEEYNAEFRILWKDQSVHYIAATGIVIRDKAGNALQMIGTNLDITKSKEAEKNVSQSEARLNEAQAIAHIGNWGVDLITGITIWSDEFYRIFGIKHGEVTPSLEVFLSLLHTEDISEAREKVGKAFETRQNSNFLCRRKPEADGRIRYLYTEWKFDLDQNGKPIRMYGILQDVTDRKEAEKEILALNENLEKRVEERTNELVESNKALEAFSYSVSHDLRSPVRSVMGFAKLIKKNYSSGINENAKELLDHIEDSGKRMNAIIDDLLSFAKWGKEKLQLTEVDLTALFEHVWKNTMLESPHQAVLELQPLPKVVADKAMIRQVVINLISNAVKYSSKKEKPVVKIGFEQTANEVIFHVSDNGAGFDMAHYGRLFSAFQRLHGMNEFEGTGIGLTLIKTIIEKHKGRVWAEGKVNEGATFYFTLPVSP